MPIDLDSSSLERRLDALGEGLEVPSRESEDGRSCAGEADSEETWVGEGSVGGEDEGETRDLRERREGGRVGGGGGERLARRGRGMGGWDRG